MLLRMRLAFLGLLLVGIAIIVRISDLQWRQGTHWRAKARNESFVCRTLPAVRGSIYSCPAHAQQSPYLLATSLPFYRLAIDPGVASDQCFKTELRPLSQKLAAFFQDESAQVYEQRIRNARRSGKHYLVLQRKPFSHHIKKDIAQWPLLRHGQYRGGSIFEKNARRFRPFRYLAQRTLGFINQSGHGAGLEMSFNTALQGLPGKAIYRKALGGHWQGIAHEDNVRPMHGYDLYTTLDINIQDLTHQALLRALRHHEAAYGCAIVMEVATGAIKAMVNLKRTAPDRYQEVYNYALGPQGCREPGSTFKVASMMAVLEETPLPLTHQVDTGTGVEKFYDRTMRDIGWRRGGLLTLQQIIERSSNIGIARLVEATFGHQPQRFIDYLHQFGLASPLQLQLQGAAVPHVKSPNDPTWSGTTLPWMAYGGYELEVSPLQLLAFFNAIANNGYFVQPLLVREVRQARQILHTYKPQVARKRICTPATLAKIKTMLEGVVARGAGRPLAGLPYKVAGKTGTAQRYTAKGYTNTSHYVSFIAYFPADRPRYSCLVSLDDPQGKGKSVYGGTMAAPVVRAIADRLTVQDPRLHLKLPQCAEAASISTALPRMGASTGSDRKLLCQHLKLPCNAIQNAWVQPLNSSNEAAWKEQPIDIERVPDTRGMALRDALFLLENLGFQVAWQGKGFVKQQSLSPGQRYTAGQTMLLNLVP